MQLVGEVMGQVSDALHNSGVNGFDETNVKNDIGRIILEAAGSAAVAGATGGNVGAAAGSAVAGNIATSTTFNSVYDWAKAQSNGDPKVATALTNAIENAIAGAIGAGAGGALNGGSGALNGLGISSDLQQYNQAAEPPERIEEEARRGDYPAGWDSNGRYIDPAQAKINRDAFYDLKDQIRAISGYEDYSVALDPDRPISQSILDGMKSDLRKAQDGTLLKPIITNETGEYKPEATPQKNEPLEFDDFDNNGGEYENINQSYLDEMAANGVKFSPDKIVRVEKLEDGRIVFLEKGNDKSGLQHIIEEHGSQFAGKGVSESEIPDLIMETLKGKPVGYQGKGTGRPIYEITINGKRERIAITTSSNGYIVGANLKGSVK
ncbi:hypothetical protein [Commensalibacter nepenthis]|uniref:Uncharacterized protein n=1 Tax=Commensalibacter nepenthis TaxID=3043872 RepID=A0ABT6Q4F3_9PROT|nr:hypothetical protein [Commensalibacter sp. TBRC 10068]MDI2111769.1 hypothetical protein [Commensalibacter sp. TBRC 10068]